MDKYPKDDFVAAWAVAVLLLFVIVGLVALFG